MKNEFAMNSHKSKSSFFKHNMYVLYNIFTIYHTIIFIT